MNKRSRVLPAGLALNVVAALLLLSVCQLANSGTSWLRRGSIQHTKSTISVLPSNSIHSGTSTTFVVSPDSIQNAPQQNTTRTTSIAPSNSINSGTPQNGRGTTLVVPSSSIKSAALQRLRFISALPSALHRTRLTPVQDVSFVYAESFRKGPTRVTESASEVVLTPQSPTCRIRVKDQAGKDRYELGCFPQQASETDPRITSWEIRLADLHHKIYTNVLASAVDPTRDATQIGWLDPGKFAKILITRERVIKIDGFYCTLQVKDYRFVNPDQPYLDRMTLVVHFTNSMPHMQVIPKEGSTGA